MSKIEIKNLYKIFGKNPNKAMELIKKGLDKDKIMEKTKQVVGLNNVSLSINEGEIFVVMGLSGSGKSTLIRCLNRLIEPTYGSINIDNKDIVKMNHKDLLDVRRKKMGMVFQSFALFPHITVLDNAAYGLKIQGYDKDERRKLAANALESVGLAGWEDSYPQNLSGGMQQRVGLARALANDPDVLLMDEAFSALDPLIRGEMQDELMELQSSMNKTIVFITHDLDEALKLGDRIALLKDGEVVQVGTPEEILTAPETEYVEKFVENVDKTKTLTASQVMKKPKALVYLKDGPRVALHKMKEYGFDSMFVVDKNKKVKGILTDDDAAKALKEKNKDLLEYVKKDFDEVNPDTVVNDMFDTMAEANGPVAVTSDDGYLKGIIVRATIFQGLAGGENYAE
ncbi:quaternary amine ABC transporter ATP-binding protein [Clostridiisalibacter paucivorans]|uniref:quaternary amine ABC transporter ATP-binding protein n=1 Tax=Clostridiisalibacter paucivorans TaxID=408753 RepID=UPI00047ACDE4|nr:glycine betaine/L-proline ABC transporter ATP-binding protein [Clostridiisalibacter paucivorans]